jgi:HPt (histidine-containing phosphotransfer) domain-containing protein
MEPPEQSRLSLLKEYLGDDPVAIKEMVDLFLQTYPDDIKALEHYCTENDYENIQKTAHRLKSSVHLFNIEPSHNLIVEIENLAKKNASCEQIAKLAKRFKSLMINELNIIKSESDKLS